jgi:hypothetical protein
MRSLKQNYAFTLNGRDPQQAAIIAILERAENQAAVIKEALFIGMGQGSAPGCTSQEVNELLARIASLEQQLETAQRQAARASEYEQFKENVIAPAHEAAQQAADDGIQLTPAFLAGVRKIPKPGIRLE